MKADVSKAKGGVTFLELLLLLFIGLKLAGVIDWSWWWVLSPFWIPCALIAVLLLVYGVLVLISRKRGKT